MNNDSKLFELIAFIENNKSINEMTKATSFFDIINSNERSYTSLLAWLLDTKESHQLKNDFLNELIIQINLKSNRKIDNESFQDALVISEEKIGNDIPDILIIKNNQCIVIENKLGAKEHNNQLDRYLKFKDKYKSFKFTYVYLDINFHPQQPQKENWIYLDYEWIITFLERKLKNKNIEIFPYSLLNSMLTELKDTEYYQDLLDKFCITHAELINKNREFLLDIDNHSSIIDLFTNQINYVKLNFIYQYYYILDEIRYRLDYIDRMKLIKPILDSHNKVQTVTKQLVSYFPKDSKYIQLTHKYIDKISSQAYPYVWFLYIEIKELDNNSFSVQLRIYIGKELTEKQKSSLKKFVTSKCNFIYRHSYVLKEYSKKCLKNELKETIQIYSMSLYKIYKEVNTIINL